IAVHDVERIAGLPHVQPRERAPSPSDGVESAALAVLEQAGVLERRPDDLFRLLDRLRRNVLQRETPERQRQTALDPLPLDLGEFERAAAEVTDDAIRFVEARYDAERRQLSLALAGQNIDLGAADALGFGDESLAVLGIAAGGGRDRPERGDLHAVAQGAKAPQRRERLLDGIGGQPA